MQAPSQQRRSTRDLARVNLAEADSGEEEPASDEDGSDFEGSDASSESDAEVDEQVLVSDGDDDFVDKAPRRCTHLSFAASTPSRESCSSHS